MNKLMIFCLLLALAVPVLAVDDNRVMYAGGTVPALPVGTVGLLDTTSEESLTFEYSGTKVLIPYSEIESFEYSTEVTRHLGVLPAIAVGLIKMRQHRHYFRISYRSPDKVPQVVVFEVPKHMPRTLQAVLMVRAPQTCNPRSVCATGTVKAPFAGRY
ncbi:MAG: hypothetical protein WB683_18545 [Candidatus Sulfotelmatobacter sp.]